MESVSPTRSDHTLSKKEKSSVFFDYSTSKSLFSSHLEKLSSAVKSPRHGCIPAIPALQALENVILKTKVKHDIHFERTVK